MSEILEQPCGGGDVYLGTLLGRRQAFSAIAARCTAADAAALREIRTQKAYRSLTPSFEEFCSKHLGVSHRHANRLIRYLDDFGPEYFTLAQLTGISPAQYRAIAPAVKDQAVHHNGQVIALLPENSEKLAAAVTALRAAALQTRLVEPSADERWRRIERRIEELEREVRALAHALAPGDERARLASLLAGLREGLQRLELEIVQPA